MIEGSALELGRYVALLCKGNPRLLEPMFLDWRSEPPAPPGASAAAAAGGEATGTNEHTEEGAVPPPPLQTSWIWQELCTLHRQRCLRTQRCTAQYVGFISDRLHKAKKSLQQRRGDSGDGGSQIAEERKAAKYLYHALHKLSQLRCILRTGTDGTTVDPQVWLPTGSIDHTRIMRTVST